MAQWRTSSRRSPLQRTHTGRTDNLNTARRIRHTQVCLRPIQEFEHQRPHRINARITRTHEGNILALTCLFKRITAPRLFATQWKIRPILTNRQRPQQIDGSFPRIV